MANGIVLNIDTTKSEFQNPMVQLRQGDGNYQSLDVTVTSNGEPFDLTGWTITFMGTTAGGFKIIDAASVVTNALQGEFTYTPTKAWGQDEGEFKNAYFKFVKSDETASGASFRVNVLDAVDLTAEEAGDYISVVDALIDNVKTSMETKLAETKQTLADTQSQANTVQTNVNELNTNVNDLKTQNNNIKTFDNTWTGTNTFNKQIIAPAGVQGNADTATKLQNTRKINGVGFDGIYDITIDPVVKYINTDTDLFTLSNGFYYFNGVVATNKPAAASNYFTVEVIQNDTNGFMRLIDNNSSSFWTTKNLGYWWNSWHKDADDSTVVHNTGTETVAGDKTFTGLSTFAQAIQGNLTGNSGTTTKLQTPRKINGTNFDGTYDINVNAANDDNIVHRNGNENIAGDKTFTGSNTFTGKTSFWFKQIQWNSGIMQGTWYLQRMGNFVFARFEKSQNTGTGTTSLSLPVGYRPINNWILDAERGQAGINGNGTVYIGTAYTDNTSMTFVYPTNDAWPTA